MPLPSPLWRATAGSLPVTPRRRLPSCFGPWLPWRLSSPLHLALHASDYERSSLRGPLPLLRLIGPLQGLATRHTHKGASSQGRPFLLPQFVPLCPFDCWPGWPGLHLRHPLPFASLASAPVAGVAPVAMLAPVKRVGQCADAWTLGPMHPPRHARPRTHARSPRHGGR